jgi:hypothetical protein
MRKLAGLVLFALLVPTLAPAQDLIPDRRFVMTQDQDLPGGDLAQIFDTTVEACQRACLTDSACTAMTFNSANGSCFPKANPGTGIFFAGAWSGLVLDAAPGAEARAAARRAEAPFLYDWDVAAAVSQAQGLANEHYVAGWSAEDLRQSANDSLAAGDPETAARFLGAAVNVTDAAGDWNDYALALGQAAGGMGDLQYAFRDRAIWAAINAWLRADGPAERATVLVTLGDALEAQGRGREKVAALRLAQALAPRDDTAAALDAAIALYGFRIVETLVQADSARPRICANFSEPLAERGVDYGTFVQLPEPGLTVARDGTQLCVEGVQHGATYRLAFREGLPAADGQTLTAPVEVTHYVRDRSPGARFPGRGYILPSGGGAAVPVETVNTERLDLTLFRVTDRNILRAMQDGFFGTPMQTWQAEPFAANIGTEVWAGVAEVAQEVNRDVTTRLPMDGALEGQPPGIYALRAAVPGVDPYMTAPAWQWFVVSDLGITTLAGADGLHVIARSLGSAAAVAGAEVELVSQGNEVLGTAATDAMGHAVLDPGLMRGRGAAAPAMVVVRQGDDMAFLSLTDPEFDLSDRGVEGRPAAPPVDVFLTTDRGAYRAGETVHVTALARDPQVAAIAGLPMTALWFRPDGVEHARAVVNDWNGGYVFSQAIAGAAPRGIWRVELRAEADGPALAAQTFLVEDFLPERIDFALTLADAPVRLGETPDLSVAARYLFGAPGADLAIEGEVLLQQAAAVEGYPGYVWGDRNAPFGALMEAIPPAITDADGRSEVALPLPQTDDPGVPLELRATVRVAEGSGRPVERAVTRALEPAAALIGVRPGFDGTVPEGAEATFQVIGIGPGAEGAQARWTVSRIETDYQWYSQDGQWFWEPVTTRTPAGEGTLTLGRAPASVTVPTTWGEYELRIEGAGAVTTVGFSAGWFAPAGLRDTPDTLEMSLDREAYAPGDTATLRVVPRAAGVALVTVLSNRVIAMQAVEVTEGENLIPLPVTDEWGAGAYVTVSALRPMDVAAGRNPQRAMGLSYAAVAPGDRQLQVAIEAPAESDPRAPLDVAVRVSAPAGETAYVTLAAVDQGILNLTAFAPPDPSGHYFGQRRLGVGIRDVYGRLIDGLTGAEGTVRSGGDAGANARLQAPPPTEQLVAFFSGPVEVGADGLARVSFDLPAFNGEVRLMAVAWTPTAVGQADASVLVRDPVVVTASLPRFMAPGDTSRLLLEITHATGPVGEAQLAVAGNGVTTGVETLSLRLEDRKKTGVSVPVTALAAGIHTIDVTLTTPDGRVLTRTLTLPVQENDPEVARISRLDLLPGQTFTFDPAVFDGLDPVTARATLAAGPIARLNAPGILASLDRYPYGCTEQIAAVAMPLLYFDEIATAMAAQGAPEIAPRVQQAIDAVLMNQTAEGAFGLWRPMGGDFWLDAFVTDFLSRARAAGYQVPEQAFRNALANLRNQVNFAPGFTPEINNGGEALAYALMVLAREGAAAIGDLRYYADVKGDDFATALAQAQLGAALAFYGDQVRADAMFARAAARLDRPLGTDQILRADFGSDDRDAAGVLTLAVEAGSTAVDREAIVSRLATRDAPLSTQEATWRLLAAHALLGEGNFAGLTIDGQPAGGPLVRTLLPGTTAAIANTRDTRTALTITTFGVPTDPVTASGNGYAITRSHFTLDGEPADLALVPQGTRLVTVLEVTPFARGEARLMVNDPLPAGFEIDNPNLIAGGSTAQLAWLDAVGDAAHTEFRQDRFLTAIDRFDNSPFRLAYIVRAVSPGSFHHPAASVEDMYRPDFRATTDAGRVTIAE